MALPYRGRLTRTVMIGALLAIVAVTTCSLTTALPVVDFANICAHSSTRLYSCPGPLDSPEKKICCNHGRCCTLEESLREQSDQDPAVLVIAIIIKLTLACLVLGILVGICHCCLACVCCGCTRSPEMVIRTSRLVSVVPTAPPIVPYPNYGAPNLGPPPAYGAPVYPPYPNVNPAYEHPIYNSNPKP